MPTNFTVSNGTTTYPLAEMEISFTGSSLDEAQFTIAGVYALDAAITIYANSGSGDVAQFIGYIKDIEEVEQGALYKYTAYEKAVELKTQPYLSSGSDIFHKTSITVANLATDILTSTPDSGWTLDTGMADTTVVSMNFYLVNRLQALNKVLREIRGYYVLFNSSTKKVKFLNSTGINTDRSASNMVYTSKKLISSSMLRGISQVVVIGKDSSVRGEYGSSTTSRAYYQVSDIDSNDEALKIATAIYGDIGVTYADYEVAVSPDQIQYDVRDKVQLDGSYFWITKVVQSMDEIVLTLDDGRTSVIDSLGSRIKKIEGDFPEGADGSWSGGNANVAANGALETTYVFDVADATAITEAELDVTISNFDKNTDVGVTTEYLSAPSTVESTDTADSSTFLTTGTYYYPSSTGLNLTNGGSDYMNGFQFGFVSIIITFVCNADITDTLCSLDYKLPGGSWTSIGDGFRPYLDYTSGANNIYSVTWCGIIPGSSTQESSSSKTYVRLTLEVGSADSGELRLYRYAITAQRTSRHVHSITTVYNKVTPANTPAATVLVKLNSGGTYTSVTPGTAQALSTFGTLVTGKNTIYVKTPSGADNMCSVNPSITYRTL